MQQLQIPGRIRWPRRWLGLGRHGVSPTPAESRSTPALRQANQALVLSSASLGLTAASAILTQPLLSLASLRLMLYVFIPTFQNAWHNAVKERRVTNAVLDTTTGFGNHLRTLGPYAVGNFLIPAAQRGIVIKDARALEKANLVNTLLFDALVLINPAVRATAKQVIHSLRQRPWLMQGVTPHRFAAYLLVNSGEEDLARAVVAELGLDDYFVESLPLARAQLVERLQQGGRFIGYVGVGQDDDPVMTTATVAIAHRGLTTLPTNNAQVVLLDQDLTNLPHFFALANAFMVKQSFNLLIPVGVDLVDIATTVLTHFGLVYSVVFNYTGLLLSAAQAHPTQPI